MLRLLWIVSSVSSAAAQTLVPVRAADAWDVYLPNGAPVVVTRHEAIMFGWDAATAAPLWYYAGGAHFLEDVRVDDVVPVVTADEVVHLDAASGQVVRRLSLPFAGRVWAHPGGSWGFVTDPTGRLALWGSSPDRARSFLGRVGPVVEARFTVDGATVVLLEADGILSRWSVASGSLLWRTETGVPHQPAHGVERLELRRTDNVVRYHATESLYFDLDSGGAVERGEGLVEYIDYPEQGYELRWRYDERPRFVSDDGRHVVEIEHIQTPLGAELSLRLSVSRDLYAYVDGYGDLHIESFSRHAEPVRLPWQNMDRFDVRQVLSSGAIVVRNTRLDANGLFLIDPRGDLSGRLTAQGISGFDALHANNSIVVVSEADGFRLFDYGRGELLWSQRDPTPARSWFSPDGAHMMRLGGDQARVYDVGTGELLVSAEAPWFGTSFRWSPEGGKVVMTGYLAAMDSAAHYFTVFDLDNRAVLSYETELASGQAARALVRDALWIDEDSLLLFSGAAQLVWDLREDAKTGISRDQARRRLRGRPRALHEWSRYEAVDGVLRKIDYAAERARPLGDLHPLHDRGDVSRRGKHTVVTFASGFFQLLAEDRPDEPRFLHVWNERTWALWDREGLVAAAPGAERFLLGR